MKNLSLIAAVAGNRAIGKDNDLLCHLTEIHHDFPDADTFFPEIDLRVWKEIGREDFPADDRHAYAYSFVVYERF